MTYRAAVPIGDSGRSLVLAETSDIDALITLLARDDAGAATIQDTEDDPVLDVQVSGGFGYLYYSSDDFAGPCTGDETSPPLLENSEFGFPAGSGVPIPTFRTVLVEFVQEQGARPTTVNWTAESPTLYQ